jgi:hypothetical protein
MKHPECCRKLANELASTASSLGASGRVTSHCIEGGEIRFGRSDIGSHSKRIGSTCECQHVINTFLHGRREPISELEPPRRARRWSFGRGR